MPTDSATSLMFSGFQTDMVGGQDRFVRLGKETQHVREENRACGEGKS